MMSATSDALGLELTRPFNNVTLCHLEMSPSRDNAGGQSGDAGERLGQAEPSGNLPPVGTELPAE